MRWYPVGALVPLLWLALAASGSIAASEAPGGSPPPSRAEFKAMSLDELPVLDNQEDMALLCLQIQGDQEHRCIKDLIEASIAAADVEGLAKLGLVRFPAADLPKLARYGLDNDEFLREAQDGGCATRVVLLKFGLNKAQNKLYETYRGVMAPKDVYKWVTWFTPDTFTTEVTGATFQDFASSGMPSHMGGPGAEWEDYDDPEGPRVPIPPKVLLLTKKDKVPAVFRALSVALRNRTRGMRFGWLRADLPDNQFVIDTLKPQKNPGMLMLAPVPREIPGKDGKMQQGVGMSAQSYVGPTSFRSMSEWLDKALLLIEGLFGVLAHKTVPVPQITSAQDFTAHCVDKGTGICLIGLLDGSRPKSVEASVKKLSHLAANYTEQPLHFAWLDAHTLRAFARDLGVLSSDLPALVALSPTKLRAVGMSGPLLGSGSGAAVRRFLDGVLSGDIRTQPINSLPRVAGENEGSAQGDEDLGIPVEEEFDLSEVLSEEVEGSEVLVSKEQRLKEVDRELEERQAAAAQEAGKKSKKKKKKGKKAKASDATKEEL